jgi:hypothetical protein
VQEQPVEMSHLLQKVNSAMDAATCMLFIMTSTDIDRRLLSEENIEHCVLLSKHVLERLLYPAFDRTAYTNLVLVAGTQHHDKRRKDNDKNKNTTTTITPNNNNNINVVAPQQHGAFKKKIERAALVPVACDFLDAMETLVNCVKLQDGWILQLTSILLRVFSMMDNSSSSSIHASLSSNVLTLQLGALKTLRSIFVHCPTHRSILFDDAFHNGLLKLSTTTSSTISSSSLSASASAPPSSSKRGFSLRGTFFKVDDAYYVHMTTILFVTLVQSGIVHGVDLVRDLSRQVIHLFLLKCMKKEEEADGRLHFETFVNDLLVLLLSPDWPAAEMLVEALVAGLTALLSKIATKTTNKVESQSTVLALHLLGLVAATLKKVTVVSQETEGNLTKVLEENQVTSVAELLSLYVQHHVAVVSSEDARLFHACRCENEAIIDHKCSSTKNAAVSLPFHPSSETGREWMGHFLTGRDLCTHADTILVAILSFLSKGQTAFRSRVLKAIGMIVDADPLLMANDKLQEAITGCLLDEATSVRQAAVDLVGKYIELQPSLVIILHTIVVVLKGSALYNTTIVSSVFRYASRSGTG